MDLTRQSLDSCPNTATVSIAGIDHSVSNTMNDGALPKSSTCNAVSAVTESVPAAHQGPNFPVITTAQSMISNSNFAKARGKEVLSQSVDHVPIKSRKPLISR